MGTGRPGAGDTETRGGGDKEIRTTDHRTTRLQDHESNAAKSRVMGGNSRGAMFEVRGAMLITDHRTTDYRTTGPPSNVKREAEGVRG